MIKENLIMELSVANKRPKSFCIRNLKVFGWIGQTMEEMVIEDAVQLAKIVEKESRDGSIKNMDFLMSFAVLNSLWSIIRGSK